MLGPEEQPTLSLSHVQAPTVTLETSPPSKPITASRTLRKPKTPPGQIYLHYAPPPAMTTCQTPRPPPLPSQPVPYCHRREPVLLNHGDCRKLLKAQARPGQTAPPGPTLRWGRGERGRGRRGLERGGIRTSCSRRLPLCPGRFSPCRRPGPRLLGPARRIWEIVPGFKNNRATF